MNTYRNTDHDIHKRIFRYVTSCFRTIIKNIPKSTENVPIIQQVSSSLTSIGANDMEADSASSARDFIAKYTIVRKETKETVYWLTFLKESLIINAQVIDPYIQEGKENGSIISKIINNTKAKLQ